MIGIPQSVRILIGSTPIDMRKSIDGLTAIVQEEMGEDAYSGHLFVFVSRRGDRVKILTWDKGGFVLLYKRLERGQFKLPHMDPSTMAVEIDARVEAEPQPRGQRQLQHLVRWRPRLRPHDPTEIDARV